VTAMNILTLITALGTGIARHGWATSNTDKAALPPHHNHDRSRWTARTFRPLLAQFLSADARAGRARPHLIAQTPLYKVKLARHEPVP